MNIWNVKILWTAAMVALVCMLTAGQAQAFDQDDLDRLLKHKQCEGCDLSKSNLSNTDLTFAHLTAANLSGADLSGANLYKADLFVANLSGANLSGTNLYEADLTLVNLSGADLSGAIWIDRRRCAEGSIGECK